MALEVGAWPIGEGLCPDRTRHAPHEVTRAAGWPQAYRCHADQRRRLPAYGERLQRYRPDCYLCQMGDPHAVHRTPEEYWHKFA